MFDEASMFEPSPTTAASEFPGESFDPSSIERPDPALLKYYTWVALLTLVAFPFVFLPLYCKYITLRYKFDDKGVSMAWGVLFKKEIYLTYRRIQDIHVTRNLFHRWLGLAEVSVQTASGTSGAEMSIEGIRNPEVLRDFLYSKMRGVEEDADQDGIPDRLRTGERNGAAQDATSNEEDEALALLREIRDGLRELKNAAETRRRGEE
jgi:putative membrane protein